MMSRLYATDVLKLFHDYEPSKEKVWRFVESFNPHDIAVLLGLLENVSKSKLTKVVDVYTLALYKGLDNNVDLKITHNPAIRFERSLYDVQQCHKQSNRFIEADDVTIYEVVDNILGKKEITSKYERILQNNLSSYDYSIFLKSVQNLLLGDNFKSNRNEFGTLPTSIVTKFKQWYSNLKRTKLFDYDPRTFRFLILPEARRIVNREYVPDDSQTMFQPLYQGFHVIIYSSPNETKCYNRFGELHANLAYGLRTQKSCTFEAVILPLDSLGNARSWRYWEYRKQKFLVYITDVFRYEDQVLIDVPFEQRIRYAELIEEPNNRICVIPKRYSSWSCIENEYVRRRDVYDPIIGVIARKRLSLLSDATPPCEFRFNILYAFDLLQSRVISLNEECNVHRLHSNYEMADYKTVCIAYGHDNSFIYLCKYNSKVHQFVHAATLERLPCETFRLTYRPERIYVVNNMMTPMGVMYLRLHYDRSRNFITGYETKGSDGRFKVLKHNPLY